MNNQNYQSQNWSTEFGESFTGRYFADYQELDDGYKKLYGTTRTEMNKEFIGELDREISILEVGANSGLQLQGVQNLGFKHLNGIDIQRHAIELSKKRVRNIDISEGSALDIPFKDGCFDLVFTAVTLIHIAPENINRVLDEIYRCSKTYIWGFEYYADTLAEINYHGEDNMLWKTNFAKLYLDRFKDLRLIKEKKYKYLENNNVDSMFLLKKE